MALRWARLVTVAMIGPRSIGSAAPQRMGIGCGPCRPGWEVSTIFGCLARRGGADKDPPQDIQDASGWSSHLVVTFFQRLQNSTAGRPVMSPCPNLDSLLPPKENGSRGTGTPMFTPTMPLVARSLTSRATAPL